MCVCMFIAGSNMDLLYILLPAIASSNKVLIHKTTYALVIFIKPSINEN